MKNLFKKKTYTEVDFQNAILNNIFNQDTIDESYNESIDLNKIDENGETLLHKCAQKAYIESAKWLLEKGVDIECKNSREETALFYAMNSNNSEIVKFLLENGANINHLNQDKRTALQEAVIAGKRTYHILLKNTDNLNNQDIHGNNLIFDATSNGNMDIIQNIIQNKDIDINCVNKNGNTILHNSNILKNDDLAVTLLENGADPTILDNNGKNFLFYTISKGIGAFLLINKALEYGCDLNCRDSNNRTLLMEAINNFINSKTLDPQMRDSHLELIKTLISLGIDINAVNDKEETLYFDIVRSDDLELINYFFTLEDINVNQKNKYGETLLMYACYAGIQSKPLIKALLALKADANIRDSKGETIIEKIIEIILHLHNKKQIDSNLQEKINPKGEYFDLLKFLLENTKVDLFKYNSKGQPIFFDSIVYYNFDLFKLFKKHEININQKDINHHNIIFYLMDNATVAPLANQKTYLNTLQSLINLGVDINATDVTGATALHKAILDMCIQTIKLLLDSKPNYEAQDENGRNIAHNVVWKNCSKTFKLINSYNQNVVNQADKFGVLPINYAAFMGHYELVTTMLDEAAHVNNTNNISPKMIEFFSKFHDNIKKLTKHAKNSIDEQNLKLLTDSMMEKFEIKD